MPASIAATNSRALGSPMPSAVSAGPGSEGLRAWLTENTGVTLGIGLGMAPPGDPARDQFFRIGHMGHVNAQMVLGVIGALETGLTALQIPHGKGAMEAAAGVLASGWIGS